MNILVIGSGGREHALAWALSRSPSVDTVSVAPGNPGTAGGGPNCRNVPLDPMDFDSVARFAKERSIDLVVVGPENPLAAGIADFLRSQGISVFGPGAEGAGLESSKSAAKEFMGRHGIPHPAFASFTDPADAVDYVRAHPGPWVLKADGLALGKGVTILTDLDSAVRTIEEYMVDKVHGEAGRRLVIEEFLTGREVSAMALCDGKTIMPLPLAKDHKRVFDGDLGPMTGGMGAYSPVPLVDNHTAKVIKEEVLDRTLAGLQEEGIDYRGVIYAGLMLTDTGPKVLEYNVRFGDPETQCVLPRLKGDFAQALLACAEGRLRGHIDPNHGAPLSVAPEACVAVILASGGYPGKYRKGVPICGLDEVGGEAIVFHAGTAFEAENAGKTDRLVTAGGRVLAVTATGQTVSSAAGAAYRGVDAVRFAGKHYRSDIGISGGQA